MVSRPMSSLATAALLFVSSIAVLFTGAKLLPGVAARAVAFAALQSRSVPGSPEPIRQKRPASTARSRVSSSCPGVRFLVGY